MGSLLLAGGAAALCGVFLHPHGFVLLAGIGAVLAVGVAGPWLGVLGLRGTLAFDAARVREGEPVRVRLRVHNRCPWPAEGLTVRGVLPGEADQILGRVPAWRTREFSWAVVPDRRGDYPASAPQVVSGFPFGLREVSRPLGAERPLLVWPRAYPAAVPDDRGATADPDGAVSARRTGTDGDVLGVRPYRRGDSPRRIHWGQTARHDRLVVCELQAHARTRVWLVVDTHPDGHSAGAEGSREWCLRVAASLAEAWLAGGAEVGAVVAGRALDPAGGGRQRARLLDALARVPAEECVPLAGQLEAARGWPGLRVVVTTDAAAAQVPAAALRGPGTLLVLLKVAGFGGSYRQAPAGVAPWLELTGTDDVPRLLRRGGKGGGA